MATTNAPLPRHLAHLPIGVPIPMPDEDSIPGWEIFPFAYNGLHVKPLGPVELPEPPRNGEDGPDHCFACEAGSDSLVWSDDDWAVRSFEPTSLPAMVMLSPVQHADLGDLSPRMLASLGTMLGRLGTALGSVDGVARVHFNKWGDGGAHLHWFAMARPAGLQQLRGSCLVLWDDLLPNIADEVFEANLATVAAALATDGGTAHRT